MGIESSPAVSNGRVFFGAPDGKIYALEAQTGSKIWAFKTDGEVSSSPVVSGSVVYVLSANGHFYALDADRGSKLWDFSSDSADMLV
jgi:outer membrane protein assembly factor BamB